MSYIEKNLNPNEIIVHRSKLHWFIFMKPIFVWAVAILLLLLSRSEGLEQDQGELFMGFGVMMVIFIAIPYSISIVITFLTSEFAVTNKRVIAKIGFIRRASLETLLQKIEGIEVDQGILGRIFDFGSISVRGVGGGNKPIKTIAEPMALRRAIYCEIEKQGEATAAKVNVT